MVALTDTASAPAQCDESGPTGRCGLRAVSRVGASTGTMTTLTLPMPSSIRHVVFSDFDETYLAHAPTAQQQTELAELEDFLMANAQRYGLLFGWVTGSSFSAVRRRMALS